MNISEQEAQPSGATQTLADTPQITTGNLNLAFVESLYADYLNDPEGVAPEWRQYFEHLEAEDADGATNGHSTNGHTANGHAANVTNGHTATVRFGPSFQPASLFNPPQVRDLDGEPRQERDEREERAAALQDRVDQLIRAYRVRGHLMAQVDPLGLAREHPPEVDPEFYGLEPSDMHRRFSCETLHAGGPMPLDEILERLRDTYCRSIGVQYMHIDDLAVRQWLQNRMEATQNRAHLTDEEQVRILTRLTDAVMFEEFIRRKFVGAKSFSLEGAESLIPLLDLAIEKASEHGVEEIVMGMAHRGRLNVLANIIGKSPRQIFREFEDKDPDLSAGGGDVKYHLGYVNDFKTSSGRNVHLTLCFNPSHLEFVNTVAQGRARAKRENWGLGDSKNTMCLLIHGDAAFAGEGVVQETLQLSQLPGYEVGGTLHVIVNNQIGFTTSPSEARSTHYATDIAKMLQIPIFHVNGEDPEAVAAVVQLALDFRAKWKRDVVIDMYCYRRLGHNETDLPEFTQPKLYRTISERKPVREGYLEQLMKLKSVTREQADRIAERRRDHLERELTEARSDDYVPPEQVTGAGTNYFGGPEEGVPDCDTSVPKDRLSVLLEGLTQLPDDFHPNPKVRRILQARQEMAKGIAPLDWATAEALAFASLTTEGVPIRMSGQDSERGTFSQRHAVLHDVEDDHTYTPLRHLSPEQAPLRIYNSPLSEIGVLGFDYGYSLDCLAGLTIWEAQFGDFWNVAQVIVDQFIASAEDKWHHLSGLTMLLPHGFEGMGPEHSSARLERFLNLAAEDNMQITYPTTPAQFFHLLRRQVLRRWRKPLVVMSPKSLLRHLEAVSSLDELTKGTFKRILPDELNIKGDEVRRVLLCTGKIYYELDRKRDVLNRHDVAILRVEQLYPLSPQAIEEALAPYNPDTPVMWVQEEPENMGAWRHMKIHYGDTLFKNRSFSGVSRPASASPATGSASRHKHEQETLLLEAFAGL